MTETQQDTEITLGTGKMLGLFVALVVICGVFFAVGFSLGKKSPPGAAGNALVSNAGTTQSGVRPGAGKNNAAPAASPDFGFYKAVGQKTADGQLAPQDTAAATTAPQDAAKTPSPDASAVSPATPAPASVSSPAPSPTNLYYVQVAAVTRQEDAESLVEALKKKEYPAFTANSSSADKFYRVQVGPFAELKDAEDMRKRLVGDGYNPIVKR